MPDRNDVIQAFVRAASAIPDVQLIVLTGDPDGEQRILTVIDAPRFETEYRYRVYRVELDVMDRFGSVPIDFIIYNLREISTSLEELRSRYNNILFQREHSA